MHLEQDVPFPRVKRTLAPCIAQSVLASCVMVPVHQIVESATCIEAT